MYENFNKTSYESDLGYIVNHTTGFSAEASTLSYMHQTSQCMLYYFISGSGNIKIEGKQYNFNDGDIIILNPSEMFCCSVDANKYHERIVLHFSDRLLKNFPKDCSSLYSPFINREKGVSNHISSASVKKYSLDAVLKSLLTTVQSTDPVKDVLALCKITEALSVICEISKNQDFKNFVSSTENHFINEILKFLDVHFKEEISMDSIAKEFNIDKSYLSHLFKEYVGTSLWNYVIFHRISYFNEIVSNGANTGTACQLAGFNNYSNFFRLYKKHMGITPMEFKKRNTKGPTYI